MLWWLKRRGTSGKEGGDARVKAEMPEAIWGDTEGLWLGQKVYTLSSGIRHWKVDEDVL